MGKTIIINNKDPKITDVKDNNVFGVHLTTQKSLDDFQEKSGMKGTYTTEYQHHYWSAVGRMQLGEQLLDICVPIVLFNYPQRTTSGSVSFNLADVQDTSAKLVEVAAAKFKEFMEKCGNELTEKFGGHLKWFPQDSMTLHVHPGSLSSFSGTDYCKTITDPGIVYPLSVGDKLPSFSSIMVHSGSKAKLVRTEYRLFFGTEDGDKNYRQGKCISYIKGRDPVENGPIESMFIGATTERKSYIFKDGFSGTDGDDLLGMIREVFDESEFEPNTDFIIEDNVTKGYGHTGGSWYGGGKTVVKNGGGKKNQKNLFTPGTQDEEPRQKIPEQNVIDYTSKEIEEIRAYLLEYAGWSVIQVNSMLDQEALNWYVHEVEDLTDKEFKDIPVPIAEMSFNLKSEEGHDTKDFVEGLLKMDGRKVEEYDESEMKLLLQYNFLIENEFTEEEILKLKDSEIDFILDTLGYDEEEEGAVITATH